MSAHPRPNPELDLLDASPSARAALYAQMREPTAAEKADLRRRSALRKLYNICAEAQTRTTQLWQLGRRHGFNWEEMAAQNARAGSAALWLERAQRGLIDPVEALIRHYAEDLAAHDAARLAVPAQPEAQQVFVVSAAEMAATAVA